MWPTWVLSALDEPHIGPMNLAIRVYLVSVHSFEMVSVAVNYTHQRVTCNDSCNFQGRDYIGDQKLSRLAEIRSKRTKLDNFRNKIKPNFVLQI